ncbi:MAG: hypothetical protein D6714_01245 [Bacteroidetes bacterium]|nr:MAG: hypothetical protein D6714_01245 [Bacteroidota bacterium]
MTHCYWTLVTEKGNPQKIGLLHGPRTGHLLIYCNGKVLTIDFKVLDSKVYTFFINDELCEIHLIRKGDKMRYKFRINKTADTPKNRARRQLERSHLKQSILFIGGIFLFLAAVIGFAYWYNTDEDAGALKRLDTRGVETIATCFKDPERPNQPAFYVFTVNNVSYSGHFNFSNTFDQTATPLLPILPGDEFVVKYLPANPEIHRINFRKITENQAARYKKRVLERLARNNPDMELYHLVCLVETALETQGLSALPDFYYSDLSPTSNPLHNRTTYQQLVGDSAFQKKVRQNCPE